MANLPNRPILELSKSTIALIARTLSISKNTVKSCLIKLATGKLPVAELLALEDPLMESKFHAGNPAYKDPRFEHLSDNLESYTQQLGHVGVTRKLLWEEDIIDYQEG